YRHLHSFPTRRSSDLVLTNATVLDAKQVVGNGDGRLPMTLLDVVSQPSQQLRLLTGGDQRPPLGDPDHRHVLQHLFQPGPDLWRSEEHTSELQSLAYL